MNVSIRMCWLNLRLTKFKSETIIISILEKKNVQCTLCQSVLFWVNVFLLYVCMFLSEVLTQLGVQPWNTKGLYLLNLDRAVVCICEISLFKPKWIAKPWMLTVFMILLCTNFMVWSYIYICKSQKRVKKISDLTQN